MDKPFLLYNFNPATGSWGYANPEASEKMGILPHGTAVVDAAAGKSWTSIILPEDLPSYERSVEAVLAGGEARCIRYRLKTHAGGVLAVIDHVAVSRRKDGWPSLVGFVIEDEGYYTALQKAERQAIIGRLAGGMIHDFRNLLSGVQGIVEWCGSRSGGDGGVRDALMNSVRYIERANAIINGLLRLMGGKSGEEPEAIIDVGGVVRELEPLIRHFMHPLVTINVALAQEAPPVFGKRGVLQDMVLNLCTNARDAMPDGGSLTISTAVSKAGRLVLRIEDSGHGMPPEMIDTIFEAFYSTKDYGAGLGLWMVREAVKSFDAKIDVSSEVGKGTVFEVDFPVSTATAAAIVAPPVPPSRAFKRRPKASTAKREGGKKRGKRTILLIEDEPLIRDSVSMWLESKGFTVVCANDGHAGWGLFSKSKSGYDIIIQDYVQPGGGSGEELLKRFVGVKPGLPVIVTSGHPDDALRVSVCSVGAFAFLPKPFKLQDLDELIKSAFDEAQ